MPNDRIIDRDIDLLQASIETYETQLRRCHPRDEQKFYALINAAKAAHRAMTFYRDIIDVYPVPPLER